MTENEEIPIKPIFNKTPLTEDELLEIWKQDDYHGKAGAYDCDPFTGKRTPKKED